MLEAGRLAETARGVNGAGAEASESVEEGA